MAFLKMELRQIQSNQSLMLNNLESILYNLHNTNHSTEKSGLSHDDFHDCPLPLDSDFNLSTIEDKIAGDNKFKAHLVILKYIYIYKPMY
jgi:hypothetical protein